MNSLDQDRALIENLGGPAKVAEMLGYDKDGGVQRVQNWLSRGIPAAVKIDRPDLFLPQFKPTEASKARSKAPQAAPAPRALSHREPHTAHKEAKPSNRKD